MSSILTAGAGNKFTLKRKELSDENPVAARQTTITTNRRRATPSPRRSATPSSSTSRAKTAAEIIDDDDDMFIASDKTEKDYDNADSDDDRISDEEDEEDDEVEIVSRDHRMAGVDSDEDEDSRDPAHVPPSRDFSSLVLKSDHLKRPIWVCPNGRVFLDTQSAIYQQAYDFLIAISDPVCRPQFIHEYQITSYSLYAAASLGLQTEDILQGLSRLSKVILPAGLVSFIREKTEKCGKVKLLLKKTRYFVESIYPDVLYTLLNQPIIAAARCDDKRKEASVDTSAALPTAPVAPTTSFYVDRTTAIQRNKYAARIVAEAIDDSLDVRDPETGFLISSVQEQEAVTLPGTNNTQADQRRAMGMGNSSSGSGINESEFEAVINDDLPLSTKILAFEVDANKVEEVRRCCNDISYPMLEEYDFRRDTSTSDLPIHLKPSALIRDYQEKSLSKMFGNGRARSGIIVLPCGAGKTLVGITACATVKKSTLVFCTTGVAVDQWRRQFLHWSTMPSKYICQFTSSVKDKCTTDSLVLITTYNMVSFTGKRSAAADEIMALITTQEWGLVICDEVHVAPAKMFRKCVSITHSRSKLGLTATLVREDNLVDDLFYLIGPKLYEANWLDLQTAGYIATVQCFPSECTRVLTSHGFLFLDEIQHLLSRGQTVLYACYDQNLKQFVYHPGKVLIRPGNRHRLIDFTQSDERRRWSSSSDQYGRTSSSISSGKSNGLSLLVTDDHDMFVQMGAVDQYVRPFSKLKASQLPLPCNCPPDDDCKHRRQVVRTLACAANGVCASMSDLSSLEFMQALDLTAAAQCDAFLELYGFWCGNGSVGCDGVGCYGYLSFHQVKGDDLVFLDAQLQLVGLQPHEWHKYTNIDGSYAYQITATRWVRYFVNEYGSKYPAVAAALKTRRKRDRDDNSSSPLEPSLQEQLRCISSLPSVTAALKKCTGSRAPMTSSAAGYPQCESATTITTPADTIDTPDEEHDAEIIKSAKWLWWWVLYHLDARQLRLIIRGLRRADGGWSGCDNHADNLVIFTSSVRFRDEIIVAMLHAGYSAYFQLESTAGSVLGYTRPGEYGVYREAEVVGHEDEFTPIRARHDSWRVCYSAPESAYGKGTCCPSMQRQSGVTEATYTGRCWCVQVDHHDHLIVAQRAERHNGIVTKASRPIIVGNCVEIWCEMSSEFYSSYLTTSIHKQMLLYVMNPNKFRSCEYLIRLHEARGDKVLVFSDNVFALKFYATALNKPLIYGATSDTERLEFLHHFQHDPNINTLFISKVGDNSIDLPDVNVIIQISSHFSSRRQEAQRLGRILRPKTASLGRFNAYFYTLVSKDTREMVYATKRQRFLVDQGYAFKVVTQLPEMQSMNDLHFSDKSSQHNLLARVMAVDDVEGGVERLQDDPYDHLALVHRKRLNVERKRGNALALTGADDRAYQEFERRETQRKAQKQQKQQHQLFRKRQLEAREQRRRQT